MAYKYSKDECPCGNFPPVIVRTDHEDEAIVFDVVTGNVGLRCRLCGRKFTAQLIPGDAMLGGHMVSEGNDGRPRLSLSAAKYVQAAPPQSEWRPRAGDD